jgi:hypothetical protein
MITEQIGKSEKYKDIKQVISIVITENEFIKNSPNYHHRFTMYDYINNVELTDIVESSRSNYARYQAKRIVAGLIIG